jgi:4-amino-4-deoxy-L-arabinose transferase-like glycosyltransferase
MTDRVPTPVRAMWSLASGSFRLDWLDMICCSLAFFAALAVGLAATTSGPGLTPDSAVYLSMARNLRDGRGFVTDIVGPLDLLPFAPVTAFPPGYSLLIAALMALGFPAIEAARLVSLVSFGVLGVAVYWLGYILGGRPAAILACATTLVLLPVVRLATFALSDAPFAALSAMSIVAMVKYKVGNHQHQLQWLLLSGFCVGLAALVRYYGIVWALSGLSVILLSPHLAKRRMLWSIYFSMVSLVPVVPWFVHNWIITGQFSGMDRERGYHLGLVGNVQAAIAAFDADLTIHFNAGIRASASAVYHTSLFEIGLLLAIAGAVLLTWRSGFVRFVLAYLRTPHWGSMLSGHAAIATLILNITVYVCGLIILSSNTLFLPSDWSRYLTPIYPILAVVWVDVFLTVAYRIGRSYQPRTGVIIPMLVGFASWIVPYCIETRSFVDEASRGLGWTFTAEKWRFNEGLNYLRGMVSERDVIYSDSPWVVSVLLGRSARDVPLSNDPGQLAAWLDRPKVSGASEYVIVFKRNLAGHPPPGEPPYWPLPVLEADMANLEASRSNVHLAADLSDAAIYRLGESARRSDGSPE